MGALIAGVIAICIVYWFITEVFIPLIWPVIGTVLMVGSIVALVLGSAFGLFQSWKNYIHAFRKNINFRSW